MEYIDAFLRTNLLTQSIIVGSNLLVLGFFFPAIKRKSFLPAVGIVAMVHIAVFILAKGLWGMAPTAYGVYFVLPNFLFGCLAFVLRDPLIKGRTKANNPSEVLFRVKGGKPIRVDAVKGITIQGAAGSGKTASGAGWILHDFGERSIPALIYDYKDLELSEIVLWFYRDSELPIHIFHPADPNVSVFFNPFDPAILQRREDFMILAKTFVNNLIDDGGKPFFKQAAEGAISGVLIRLKEDFPHYCTFAHVTAIFLQKDPDELIGFLEANDNARRQAKAFLDGAGSGDQTAAVLATLANAFRSFDMPSIFWTTRESGFSPEINKNGSKAVVILVNVPSYDEIYQPLLSVTAQAIMMQMSKRGRDFSYLLFDEAPTLTVNRMPRVPATMRSFGVGTIYMLQDKIQAANQLGQGKMKEILANLSTQVFGKTNDPETAKFFEAYFETIKVSQKSYSKKDTFFMEGNDSRVNISERDEKKHKSHEMFKRGAGEFFIVDDKGTSHNVKIDLPPLHTEPIKPSRAISDFELQGNYDLIMKTAKRL